MRVVSERVSCGSSSTRKHSSLRLWLSSNLFLLCTLSSVICGIVIGALIRTWQPSANTIHLIGFPGELFIGMLKTMILPLIVASLVSGLSQLDGKTSGKMGSRAFTYYFLTTVHAVVLGILLATLIHPGDPSIKQKSSFMDSVTNIQGATKASDKFLDLFRNLFSENIVRSMFQQQQTTYQSVVQLSNDSTSKIVQRATVGWTDGMNVLGVIVFSIAMGLSVSAVGEAGEPLAIFFRSVDAVVTKMMNYVMWFGPIGIPSMIAQKMLEVTDIVDTAKTLALLILTVLLGLATMVFVTLPVVYFVFTRKNPYKFIAGLTKSYLSGFATASSAAILPTTFQCLKDLGLDDRVVKFVLPVGTMLNTVGTALYEAIAPVFIAQLNGVELGLGQMVTLTVTATFASLGAASIPSAGLVTMLIVLSALGLPAEDISLIFTIDWFLDRLRTCTNITGATVGCALVNHMCKGDLEQIKTSPSDERQPHPKPSRQTAGVEECQL